MFIVGYIVGCVITTVVWLFCTRLAEDAPLEEPDWHEIAYGDSDRLATSEELLWPH